MAGRRENAQSFRFHLHRTILGVVAVALLSRFTSAHGDVVDDWARRISRLDSLYLEFSTHVYWVDVDKDVRNRDNWRSDPNRGRTTNCRVWLRRPDFRIERRFEGRDQAVNDPSDSSWVSAQLRTLGGSLDHRVGSILPTARPAWLALEPFFTPLEFHVFDYAPLDLAAELLKKPRAVDGNVATIGIGSDANPWTLRVEFSDRDKFFPQRLTMTIGSIPETQIFWDMEVLDTATVGDLPVVRKARLVLFNPNVNAAERCVYLWEAARIESRPITRSDLEVVFPDGVSVTDKITNTRWVAGDASSVKPIDPEQERLVREALRAQILKPGIESRRHNAAWWIALAAFSATLILALAAVSYRRWKAAQLA